MYLHIAYLYGFLCSAGTEARCFQPLIQSPHARHDSSGQCGSHPSRCRRGSRGWREAAGRYDRGRNQYSLAYRRHLVVGYCPRSDATDRTVARDRCQRCPEVPQPKTRGPTAYAEASAYDCRSAREPTAFHLPPAVGHHSRGVTQCAAVCRCNPTLLRQNEGGCAADRSRA